MKHLLLKLTLLALLTALCAFFVLGCDDTTADPKNSSTNSATDSNDSTASSQPSLNGSDGTIASSTPNGTGSVGGGANDPNPGPSGGDGSGDNGSNGGEGDNGEATCSVIFEENGGSPVEDIKGVAKGDTIVLPEDPKKTGYSFGGWYFDDKSFENKFDESQPITETITLYAKWTDTTRCPSCGEGGVIHDFCEFCQTRVCVGEHDTCTTTASALTTFEAGLYYLCGIYKQHSFVPGVSSATVYFEWQLILNLRDDGTFIFQYSQRANSKHPYYVLINYYGTHTFGEKLTLTLDRAFTCSDLNGTDGDPFPVAKGTTAEVTLYDDNTFSGNLNDLRGICNSCGNYLSTGKHGVCNVCFLAICDGGDHSHGASVCKQCGQSTAVGEHDTCTHCEGYLCDGQSHSLYLPCQEHFQCEGGNHMICFTCGAYKCNGKLHEKCPGCNQMGCVTTEGRHEASGAISKSSGIAVSGSGSSSAGSDSFAGSGTGTAFGSSIASASSTESAS